MSPTDARMAFERHATSKIKTAQDLFAIKTMGFRGEALASIAAIAEVELKTKRSIDDIGTTIQISGSDFISQDVCSCPTGTNFIVKNLFYNVPARRKFLKADNIELKHIKTEIYRIVLVNQNIHFTIVIDNKVELQLKPENTKLRIISVFGTKLASDLINIETSTSLVNIKGYISKPERTKKATNEQFLFVNNRYMNHPYLRKAILLAYDKLIKEGENPSYFIYFEVAPDKLDINIHPSKTEIKFEDEQYIFQILQAAVKQAFGKLNINPNMFFEEDVVREAHLTSENVVKLPTINYDPSYNPFDLAKNNNYITKKSTPKNWQKMFENDVAVQKEEFLEEKMEIKSVFFQFKNKYIITSSLSGLIIIDQRKAHERILYEKYLASFKNNKFVSQRLLFPLIYEPPTNNLDIFKTILNELKIIGFEIVKNNGNQYEISAIPVSLSDDNPIDILELLIYHYHEYQLDMKMIMHEKISLSLAKATTMKKGIQLSEEMMATLYNDLIISSNPNYTEDGKKIMRTISLDEIEKLFN